MFKELGLFTETELLEVLKTLDDCSVRVDEMFSKVLFTEPVTGKLVFTYELYTDSCFNGYLVHDYREAL